MPLRRSLLLLLLLVAAADGDRNRSTAGGGGLLWSSAKDDADLQAYHSGSEDDQLAGGFSSLDGMLQWAIGHSDPAKLKEKSNDVKRLSPNELRERQAEIKELMDKLKTPSDGELMRIAIADLSNSSLPIEDRQRALDELLILVEPIDNANDLDKLGGLIAVVRELQNSDPKIRLTSAWIIGKACQNNLFVQNKVLGRGALPKLMEMVKSGQAEEAIKALYAMSALIRNNNDGQELFYAESGVMLLQSILSNASIDIRLHKKAVFLVADLVDFQLEHMENVKYPVFSNRLLLKSMVDLLGSSDLDLQEKALFALRSLIQLDHNKALTLRDECNLEGALDTMKKKLENLMLSEEYKDFAVDLEVLRKEVETMFRRKLEKVEWVPT